MRPAILLPIAALVFWVPAAASAAGPVLTAGLVGTRLSAGGSQRYEGLTGGAAKVGFEVGTQRFRSEFAYNTATLESDESGSRLRLNGFSYQLAFHLFKKGFSPYLGAGFEVGLASIEEPWAPDDDLYDAFEPHLGSFIRPYGVLGLRLQLDCGLGFRAEMTASHYGEFVAYAHNVGVSYTW